MIPNLPCIESTALRIVLMAVALSSGCIEAVGRTQVLLVIDADSTLRPEIGRVEVSLEASDGGFVTPTFLVRESLTLDTDAESFPIQIPIEPQGQDFTRIYRVTATAIIGAEREQRAVVRIISGFRANETIVATRNWDAECVRGDTALCESDETCVAGACESAITVADDLPTFAETQRAAEAATH